MKSSALRLDERRQASAVVLTAKEEALSQYILHQLL